MRTDILRVLCKRVSGRCAALLVLTSDREVALNISGTKYAKGRSVSSLQEYNPKITRKTLYRLVEDGFVEQVGLNFRVVM